MKDMLIALFLFFEEIINNGILAKTETPPITMATSPPPSTLSLLKW